MAEFIHLHVHTAFSLSEGAIKLPKLLDLCKRLDMPAVAATDTNNLFGALQFAEMAAAEGIQPIIGLQQAVDVPALSTGGARAERPASLVFLAKTAEGYARLMQLTSRAFLGSIREDQPCADIAWLDGASDGLICLTGGPDGPLDRLIRAGREDDAEKLMRALADRFGSNLYVELQRHTGRDWRLTEAPLTEIAYRLGLPLVATNEPFFAAPADHVAHDALLCIADGVYVHQDDRRRVTPDHYFKSGGEMRALFADLPEAIDNSVEVARRCAFRPRARSPILPQFLPGGDAVAEARELERQASEGLELRLARGGLRAPEEAYRERLRSELETISRVGFAGYFLIVADFIKWAKANKIPVGPGRGSGAGSLVAWALTITDLDPLRFGLLFERFLNPERVSMPDFDIDFCQDRRDEVIAYVRGKYGEDRVAQIITFGKLQARAVLRDVGRVLGMRFTDVDRLCKLVPNNPANPVTLAEAINAEPRLREERDRDEGVAALIDIALKLEGLYRHASTHAAGVVIADRPLIELTPLYRDPRSDMPATQFNMKWVEPAGLVKFDFLGLKTLTVIRRAVELLASHGIDLDPDALPFDDPATFAMLGEGATAGVFQLESAGMRATLRALRPDSLEDIIALVSLYRPGPMENIPAYIERKQGQASPDYLHPKLEGELKETYGVIIYQEQVMRIAQILCGFSLGEADILRRAMGKKDKAVMDQQRQRFIEGAKANGVSDSKAASIFDLVEKFAGYGFNKSHAACYAYIAYQTAYLKANHPAAFLAASMSLDRTNTDKLALFVGEARQFGIRVRPPHVNSSRVDFWVDEEGAVVYALSAVKNVGEAAMAVIVAERDARGPFSDLFDFAERVDLKLIGKRALESLARAGAFDGVAGSRAAACAAAELLIRHSAQAFEERQSSQAGLFDGPAAAGLAQPRLPAPDEWSPLERLNEERAALGFYLSGHPLDDYAKELRRLNATSVVEARERARGGRATVQVAAVIRSVRRRQSRTGSRFAWVECSDASSDFEVTVFSETLKAAGDILEPGALTLMTLTAEDRDGEVRFTCESVRGLDAAAAQTASLLRISVSRPEALEGVRRRLAAVRPASSRESGRVVISMILPETGREVEFALAEPAACTPAVKGALRSVEGVADVEIV